MLIKGDKIQLVKPIGYFTNVGQTCEIIDVNDKVIKFKFDNYLQGEISVNEFDKYFIKVKTNKKKENKFKIDDLVYLKKDIEGTNYIQNDFFRVKKFFEDNTVVLYSLKDGIECYVPQKILYEYFDKAAEKAVCYEENGDIKYISEKRVQEMIDNSDVLVWTVFDKCTVVALKLPNGFVIVESFAYIDPKNYNEGFGKEVCMNRIKNKICEMEAYRIYAK